MIYSWYILTSSGVHFPSNFPSLFRFNGNLAPLTHLMATRSHKSAVAVACAKYSTSTVWMFRREQNKFSIWVTVKQSVMKWTTEKVIITRFYLAEYLIKTKAPSVHSKALGYRSEMFILKTKAFFAAYWSVIRRLSPCISPNDICQ